MVRKKAKASASSAAPPEFTPVAALFAKEPDVTAGTLMSSYGLKFHGKIFAMFARGKFVAKLPRPRVDELVSTGRAERFNPGHGRLMKEWVAMESCREDWPSLAQEAFRFVKSGRT